MKAICRLLYGLVAALLLTIPAPTLAITIFAVVPTVNHTIIAYDADSVSAVSDSAFAGSDTTDRTVPSFGQTAGLDAAKSVGAADDVFHVTPQGVALPPGPKYKIPSSYVENPYRAGSYGVVENGKFVEKLRIDPGTPPGMKGPDYSHYHLDGGKTHYSPKAGDLNPGFPP